MAGKITSNMRIKNAENFYEQFSETSPEVVYLFVGKADNPGTSPGTPVDSVEQTDLRIWDTLLAMKRIVPSDISFCIPRYDWTSGTVYTPFNSSTEYQSNQFYVLSSDYNIYKCISNNGGVASTAEPSGKSTSIIETADGYKWKYMYTITATDALKYVTSGYVPVKTLTADDGSEQWDVQQAAIAGGIESVRVISGGANYPTHSGTLQIAASNTSVTLAAGASATNDIYVGSTLYVTGGVGEGQIRDIVNYDGTTKIATVSPGFNPSLDATSLYYVGPKISATGDGTGFSAYASLDTGAIDSINVIDVGQDYSYATISATANGATIASLAPNFSPEQGHGSDPMRELFGHNVILNVKLTGSESDTFFTGNSYRSLGLLMNPTFANNTVLSGTSYDLTTKLTISSPSGDFTADETITGGTSGTTATFVDKISNTSIRVTGHTTPFTDGETITGGTSGETATVDATQASDVKKRSGEILYVEERNPINRASDQQEDLKIIVLL